VIQGDPARRPLFGGWFSPTKGRDPNARDGYRLLHFNCGGSEIARRASIASPHFLCEQQKLSYPLDGHSCPYYGTTDSSRICHRPASITARGNEGKAIHRDDADGNRIPRVTHRHQLPRTLHPVNRDP